MKRAHAPPAVVLALLAWLPVPAPAAGEAADAAHAPRLVPWPASLTRSPGSLRLKEGGRVVAGRDELAPLAAILSDEIRHATGLRLPPATGPAAPGDVELRIDDTLKGESYALEAGE